jgi:hypothetical protein
MRNIIPNDVHDSTKRARTIQQARRTANDFDATRGQRIDRHGVIRRGGGNVAGPKTIFEDKDPIAGKTTDHGLRGHWAIVSLRDAGLRCDRCGDTTGQLAIQRCAFENGRWLKRFFGSAFTPGRNIDTGDSDDGRMETNNKRRIRAAKNERGRVGSIAEPTCDDRVTRVGGDGNTESASSVRRLYGINGEGASDLNADIAQGVA